MFDGFIGNEKLIARLSSLVSAGGLGHAVLLLGEDGCGRNAFAEKLAAAYLGDTHGMVARGVHPDLLVLEGTGAMNQIPVEAMRGALTELSYSAVTTGGRRALLIRNASSLNRSSAAALLKTLEEPVDGVLFIITASSERDVIDTVASRCTKYTLLPAEIGECADAAAARTGASPEKCAQLSKLFSGRLGLVLHYIRNEQSARSLVAAADFVDRYLAGDTAGMLSAAAKPADRKAARQFWSEVSLFLLKRSADTGDTRLADAAETVRVALNELEGNLNLRLFGTRLCLALTR